MTDPVTIALLNAVLSPFVRKLTENFLNRQRNTVGVAELQDQVTRLLDSQRDLEFENTQARMVVLAFARYLAHTQREIFVLKNDRLEIVTRPPSEREEFIEHAIDNFAISLEARLKRRADGSPEAAQPRPPSHSASSRSTSSESSTGAVGVATSEALNKFFEGFEEEIMRTRLGRVEHNDRDRLA